MKPIATWWSLPKWITDLIQPKGKTSIKFTAFVHEGHWYFHLPQYLTWWEGLAPVQQLEEFAKGADHVSLTVTTYPQPDSMKLWFEGHDPLDMTASIYVDPLGRTCWLCGWLPWFFGEKPQELYVKAND